MQAALTLPEIGSLWRRRPELAPSPYLRFDRVIVVEDEDDLHLEFVCVEPAPQASIVPCYPLAVYGLGCVQAFEPARFFEEYEPDQLSLF